LGIARPGHAELAEFTGDRLSTLRIIGEGVVVEEYLLDLRQFLLRPGDFLHDMPDAARAVEMPADGLRPQAERAARFAAPPGIERQVGMLEVTDKVAMDVEVPLVDGRDEWQVVH